MDEKTFLDGLAAPKDPTTTDALFHTLNKERVDELRKKLHESIDRLFDKIDFGPDGNAISPITIEQKRDFDTHTSGYGRVVHVPKAESVMLRIEYTLAQYMDEMTRAIEREKQR